MSYDYEYAAKITDKIAYEHAADYSAVNIDYSRTSKNIVAEYSPTDNCGYTALYRVQNEIYNANFKPESAGHIHSAGVAAAYIANIRFFKMRNYYGKIETAYKIANYGAQHQPIPQVGKKYFFHSPPFSLTIIFMGVPEKSKFFLITFSKNRSYEKCRRSVELTFKTKVGGATATCEE